MLASYQGLVEDHEEIDQRARIFVADLATLDRSGAQKASQALADLASLVERHVEREDSVMNSLTGREMAAAWGTEWEAVKSSFEDLRARWLEFIARWDAVSIGAEWPRFRLEARSVFLHLKQQVARETDLFYSAALRIGAVSLRG